LVQARNCLQVPVARAHLEKKFDINGAGSQPVSHLSSPGQTCRHPSLHIPSSRAEIYTNSTVSLDGLPTTTHAMHGIQRWKHKCTNAVGRRHDAHSPKTGASIASISRSKEPLMGFCLGHVYADALLHGLFHLLLLLHNL
jgi:hypothetical protein